MRHVIRRFFLAAYGAAGVSFLASLARDYVVINFSGQSQHFFQLLYVASIAAGFGVNAIALGSKVLERTALIILALLGIIVIVVMTPASSSSPLVFGLLSAVLLLWLAGAQWSRRLIERGWVFTGRVREAIASILLAALVLAGWGVELSFLLAVAAGSVFSWMMWHEVRKVGTDVARGGGSGVDMSKLIQSIVLTNIATFSITYWALAQTSKGGEVLGFDVSTAVRFSMYLYQVVTIGSVVLVSLSGRLARDRHLTLLVMLAAICFAASALMSLSVALFLAPVSAAVVHYCVVLYLQQANMVRA